MSELVRQMTPDIKDLEGKTPKELRDAGVSVRELIEAGFAQKGLEEIICPAETLLEAGYPVEELISAGYPLKQLRAAGVTDGQLKDACLSAGIEQQVSSECTGDKVHSVKAEQRRVLMDEYGHIYEGSWRNGKPNGRGAETWYFGKGRYEGDFVDGYYEGQGVLDTPNGMHYEGGFYQSQFRGHGVCVYPSGIRYEGEFDEGRPAGPGTVYFKDGSRFEGVFTYSASYDHGGVANENSGEGFRIDAEGNREPATWVFFRFENDCSGECVSDKREYFRHGRGEIL